MMWCTASWVFLYPGDKIRHIFIYIWYFFFVTSTAACILLPKLILDFEASNNVRNAHSRPRMRDWRCCSNGFDAEWRDCPPPPMLTHRSNQLLRVCVPSGTGLTLMTTLTTFASTTTSCITTVRFMHIAYFVYPETLSVIYKISMFKMKNAPSSGCVRTVQGGGGRSVAFDTKFCACDMATLAGMAMGTKYCSEWLHLC